MGLDMYLTAVVHVKAPIDGYTYCDKYGAGEDYVSNWDWEKDVEGKKRFEALVDATGIEPTAEHPAFSVAAPTPEREGIFEIGAFVGYWRKANAIHDWFVRNVQDGLDECQTSIVSRADLKSLRETCAAVLETVEVEQGQVHESTTYDGSFSETKHFINGRVIKNPEAAITLLPAKSGFFFGGTDYDEYYLQNLEDTVKIIDDALRFDVKHYTYRASW